MKITQEFFELPEALALSMTVRGRAMLFMLKRRRRTTVKEACRLQTMPDDYCRMATVEQAYKGLGNGWTAEVIINNKILEILMAKSIIQKDNRRCYICGRYGTGTDPLDKHHIFFGPYRQKSEKYGLTVYLHHFSCHIFGDNAVHKNAEICRELQKETQKTAMKKYNLTVADFRCIFGRNYIDD